MRSNLSYIKILTDTNFESEVIKSKQLVLVDFWSEWCNPCLMISPIIDEIAFEYKEKIKVAKINVTENEKITRDYGIMSIPTLMLFKDGKVVKQIVGAVSKKTIKSAIDSHIL